MSADILSRFPYALDAFQKEAVEALERGDHVLVTAHTGSGKSLCGEYAIVKAFLENKRVIYTSPIKTLSNQKFSEFKKKFGDLAGEAGIGIQTGDVKLHPDAQCVIMTTEILRNMLFRGDDVANLGYVVFDEVHYLNDKDRGHVWEECILKLPPHVGMIMLSATMANPDDFAAWIRAIKPGRDVVICSNEKRPVPLRFFMAVPNPSTFDENSPWTEAVADGHIACLQDQEGGSFRGDVYAGMVRRWKAFEKHVFDEGVNIKKAAVAKRVAFDMLSQLNPFLNFLHINQLVPAILFTLSRKRCDQLADRVQVNMISHEERRDIENIFDFHIRRMERHEQYAQVTQMKAWLMKGVAVHHSGLFPILKEMVEILFAKGLIKVLFATETFAIGINMPTKTVVFLDVMKFHETGSRPLLVEEFKQMAGRAGRRGLDPVGHVIYFPVKEPLLGHDMERMMTGRIQAISSKFAITPGYVLRSLAGRHGLDAPHVGEVTQHTLFQKELLSTGKGCQMEADALRAKKEVLQVRIRDIDPQGKMWEKVQQMKIWEEEKKKASTKARKVLERNMEELEGDLSKAEQRVFQQLRVLGGDLEVLEQDIARLMYDAQGATLILQEELQRCVAILQDHGYVAREVPMEALTRSHLTAKALFSIEISQCHELCLGELVFRGTLSMIRDDPLRLASALGLFLDEVEKEGDDTLAPEELIGKDMVRVLHDVVDQSEAFTEKICKAGLSMICPTSMRFVAPVWEWCHGEHFQTLCEAYDLFEGNLMRTLQKLLNLLEEMKKGFDVVGDMDWVLAVERAHELVKKDLMLTDSIYLTY